MRISTHIILFLVILTAASNILVASGVAEDLGIAPEPGKDQLIQTAEQDADDPNPGGGGGDTLFGLFTSTAAIINGVYRVAGAGHIMLSNIGIPSFVGDFLFTVMPFISGLDLLYVYTGRDI